MSAEEAASRSDPKVVEIQPSAVDPARPIVLKEDQDEV